MPSSNDILDRLESVMLSVAGMFRVANSRVERWRWDAPDIAITWTGADRINRNVHATIVGKAVSIHVNAWKDDELAPGRTPGGTVQVRFWRNAEAGSLNLQSVEAETGPFVERAERVRDLFTRAFDLVSKWQKDDLKNQQVLATRPT